MSSKDEPHACIGSGSRSRVRLEAYTGTLPAKVVTKSSMLRGIYLGRMQRQTQAHTDQRSPLTPRLPALPPPCQSVFLLSLRLVFPVRLWRV
eukprot:1797658-Rhodomonas_salina.1